MDSNFFSLLYQLQLQFKGVYNNIHARKKYRRTRKRLPNQLLKIFNYNKIIKYFKSLF